MMYKEEEFKALYDDRKGKKLYWIKWSLIGVYLTIICISALLYSEYCKLCVEEQLEVVIFGLDRLTVSCLLLSLTMSVVIILYLYVEKLCIKRIVELQHKAITERLKKCLKIDKEGFDHV